MAKKNAKINEPAPDNVPAQKEGTEIESLSFGLMDGKVEAAARSKRSGKTVFMVCCEDGDFILSGDPIPGTAYAYKNGSEVALPASVDTSNLPAASTKQSKKSASAQKETSNLESNKTNKQMSKVTKSAAKKTSKPAKKEKVAKVKVEKVKLGSSSFFDKAQKSKLDAILKKADLSFNGWVNSLIFAKID